MLSVTHAGISRRSNTPKSTNRHRPQVDRYEMTPFVEQFTLPAFVLDDNLIVKGMNDVAHRIVHEGEVIVLHDGALHGSDDIATARLRALISSTGDVNTGNKKESLVLRRVSTGSALHVWGMPLMGRSRKGRKLALLFLIDPDATPSVPTPILRSIYGLTNAEGRLVEALLTGLTLESFAEQSHISVNTVRTHLKSVYRKTETNRQPELIRLLAQFMCNINFIAHQFSGGMLREMTPQH